MFAKVLIAIVSALCLTIPAAAQTVVDGDGLKLNGTTWRLWGIDAPELRQACPDGWPAGQEAASYLRALLQGHSITCEPRGGDRYGRLIGLCRADGSDVQAQMVRAGMAWAFSRYSTDYEGQEDQARALRLGVHLHGCQVPWEWRKEHQR